MTFIEKTNLKKWIILVSFVIAILLPFLFGMNQYYLRVITLILIFIIYASAWNFLTYSGQGSLGHAAFFGLGGYFSAIIVVKLGLPPILSLIIGGLLTAVIGMLIGLTCVRLREWFLAMVTFGFAVIIQTLIVSQLSPVSGGWDGFAVPDLLPSLPYNPLMMDYYFILVILILSILIFYYLLNSKTGLALAAIRENEQEARASGINPVPLKLFAFGISAFFTGIAGSLEISYFGYITPEIFGVDISFWPIIYSITGGLGTLAGPVIGTIVISILWEILNSFGMTYERFIIVGVILILVIIFLPKGLVSLPEKIRQRMKKEKS